jgi:hypothetical protein
MKMELQKFVATAWRHDPARILQIDLNGVSVIGDLREGSVISEFDLGGVRLLYILRHDIDRQLLRALLTPEKSCVSSPQCAGPLSKTKAPPLPGLHCPKVLHRSLRTLFSSYGFP